MALLLRYWRPLAVLILLLATWLHGHHYGVESTTQRYEYARAQDARYAAESLREAESKARKQEADWSAAFDAAATISHEELSHVQAHRDRLLADLRAGRLRLPSVPAADLPEAPAHPGEPQGGAEGGQPGMVGEAITGRLATCDEVTLERNQAVRLLEAERN